MESGASPILRQSNMTLQLRNALPLEILGEYFMRSYPIHTYRVNIGHSYFHPDPSRHSLNPTRLRFFSSSSRLLTWAKGFQIVRITYCLQRIH
ncbi:hypothetical protein M413DRAFT_249124 [Hebeloma cylindrosporum]|uniref:Uncharacterized protein n=1 Tax=Hebeloma cylindrosporum TaxID=76867 RepID=A0A0C3C3X7_HEBCY|nr:hypothetical protein M413DRAFT_249124 [Hebeloma cylindrosporum h7]